MITEVSPKEALQKYFGFNKFKGEQEAIIKNILSGNHTFVIMPTGGGKSMCYQLPALMSEGVAIVVSPLIALMKNQVDSVRGFSTDDSVAHVLNSSLSKGETARVLDDVSSGRTKLLYVAPESLTKQDYIDFFQNVKISFFAIDEAHCISEWGHDFRPEYRRLRPIIEEIGNVPIIALTATATPKVQQDIQKNLGMTDAKLFKASFNRDNLYYQVRSKKDVVKQMVKHIRQYEGQSGIIYCLSRKKVEEIANTLQLNGIKALPYHAGLEASLRAKTQDQFLMEDVDVIVATIAFGMGIDKPDVRFVIHHDIPKSLESYYQETGRAGRDGGVGDCLTFYSYKDIEKLDKFLHNKPVAEQEVGRQLLQEIISYSETSVCRRKYLLHYFGEEFDEKGCGGKCDNCKHPREKYSCLDEVVLLLNTIDSLKEQCKEKYLKAILTGDDNTEVTKYKGDKNPYFGKGKDKDEKFWGAVIRQCTVKGFLRKEIESYGTLKFTDLGREFLKKPYTVEIVKEHDYSDADTVTDEPSGAAKGAAADATLLKMLRDLRKQISKQKELPPFVIFQDPSLEDMATQYPINTEELTKISGVGEGKIRKYGKPFVELIAKYVTENEIERPDDLIVKSAAKKSAIRVYIIQSVDRKIPLEDIAGHKNIKVDQVIEEMERIVASGTKLNLDYYLEDSLDEDCIEEIFEYFMEAETDDFQAAYEEFDGDYTEEEMRLARIKFMSEVAN